MGTKHVRLDEDVYAKIEDKKREDETFSEAIDRLTSDWSLVQWGEKYESDGAVIREGLDDLDEIDRKRAERLIETFNVDE